MLNRTPQFVEKRKIAAQIVPKIKKKIKILF